MDDFKRWTITRRDTEYENPWIRVDHSEVIAPTGADGIYGSVHFKNLAIGIFPIDEDGFTWIVGQTRFVFDAYSWELPQGGGLRGEPPVDTAQRELSATPLLRMVCRRRPERRMRPKSLRCAVFLSAI